MHKFFALIICSIVALMNSRVIAEHGFALYAVHPNSQAFEFESSEEFDDTLQGYRRMPVRGGREMFVAKEPQVQLTAIKRVSLTVAATGSKSVMVEFTDEWVDALRELRLNRITSQFVLLNSREEILGMVSTVSIGVDTRRFSIPVLDLAEAEKLIKELQPMIAQPKKNSE